MDVTGFTRDGFNGMRLMQGKTREGGDKMAMAQSIPVGMVDSFAVRNGVMAEQAGLGAGFPGEPMPDSLPRLMDAQEQGSAGEAVSLDGEPDREQLLLEHLPTVRYLARRIHERLPQHVDLDDLISAGVVGLIDAFSKFDHTKKVQFKSYAQFRIRGAILDSLRTLDWSPRELRRKGRAVEEAIRSATQRLGRAPSEQEIAAAMELSLNDYQQLLGDLKGLEIGSLHMERTEDSGDEELAYIPGAPEDDPLFRCLKGEMKQRLADAIDELPEKERLVLTLYYYEELTMKEIGLTLGVVESRVSQIHSSAVLRLRSALASLKAAGAQQGRPVAGVKKPVPRRRMA
jgi:RNA polymerase sigma factor for flagellar operon FliA